MQHAIRFRRTEVVEVILEESADVDKSTEWGWTPLHFAAWHNQLTIVQLLLERGADPNKTNEEMQTPLHLAAFFNFKEMFKVLLSAGADSDVKDGKGMSTILQLTISDLGPKAKSANPYHLEKYRAQLKGNCVKRRSFLRMIREDNHN